MLLCVFVVVMTGRTFEYVSGEDPFVGYHMAAAVVTGIQSQGVIANVKRETCTRPHLMCTPYVDRVDEMRRISSEAVAVFIHSNASSLSC